MAEVRSTAHIYDDLYRWLHEAVVKGDVNKVGSLLQRFTKDEVRKIFHHRLSGHTPCLPKHTPSLLMVAIGRRNKKLVELLVGHYDVQVDCADNVKSTEDDESGKDEECSNPILESIRVSSPAILEMLCKKVRDINSGYPLHLACERETPEARSMLTILWRKGADVNISNGALTH